MSARRVIMVVFLIILFGCKEKAMDPLNASYQRLQAVPQQKWDSLAQKKVFFGHQSVGRNVIEGLEKVMQSIPTVRLKVVETADPGDFQAPVFAHSRIGQNRDPKGKIDHFRQFLESGIGQAADVAFFKLCYVDVDQSTNIDDLLAYYDQTLADLGQRYPKLVIIPVTLPLTSAAPGIKARIKRLLGRGPALKADNIKRNIVNDRIRKKYGAAIWDLADAEATTAEGAKVSFKDSRGRFFLLNSAYTSDGGHLNTVGSQVVAIDLLLRLASLDPR
jgi:hypothetical protein